MTAAIPQVPVPTAILDEFHLSDYDCKNKKNNSIRLNYLRKSVKTDKYLTVFGRKGAGNVHVEQRQQPVELIRGCRIAEHAVHRACGQTLRPWCL